MRILTDADFEQGVDIVVVNYRTPDDLALFLDSYLAHRPEAPHSLTIANVAPEQADLDVADQWCDVFPETEHVTFADNVGYGRACNSASTLGGRMVIAFFNADIALHAKTVDSCYLALLSDREWGALGPRQVDQDGKITAGGIFGTRAAPRHRGWKQRDGGQYCDIREDAVSVAGSAYFVRRSAWTFMRDCPTFRELYPDADGAFLPTELFYEETWLSYHLIQHGYKNVYYGPASAEHRWHRSVKKNEVNGARLAQAARVQFRAMCDYHGIPRD